MFIIRQPNFPVGTEQRVTQNLSRPPAWKTNNRRHSAYEESKRCFTVQGATADRSSKPVYRHESGFWPCPHTYVVRQVHPADGAGRIHEEFGGSRDVPIGFAALRMQHSVLANRVSIRVRKQWKRIPSRQTELPRLGGRIHADAHDFNATPMKLAQVLLKTPQLGVAEWSPIPTIENEHEPTMFLQKIGGRDLLPSRIQEHERGCFLTHA